MLNLIKKYYWSIIFVVLLISYGQILSMLPWQDDNALFFKLAHINEPAGFLGKGILGEGAYKYTAFFYYPIYLIAGFNEVYYFAFGLILYGISTFCVYKVASKLFNENTGKLAGFLYACGFIGSDSFIRLFNSVITSLSVIGISFLIYFYWKYYEEKKHKWYFLALFVFLLLSEFARARTHYLIVLVAIFELLFFTLRRPFLKSFYGSVLRMVPFVPIFYKYVISQDSRSKEISNLFFSLLQGDFYKLYGFLSSVTSLVLPNWVINFLSPKTGSLAGSYISNSAFYVLLGGFVVVVLSAYLFFKYRKTRIYVVLFFVFTLVWKYISSAIFVNSSLSVSPDQILIAYIGGELLFLSFLGFFWIDKKYKLIYIFLLSGVVVNLMSYWAYNPTQTYEKINRYLSHSLFYITILLGLLYFSASQKIKKFVLILTITWGLSNLTEAYFYQRDILKYRTGPVKAFYAELGKYISNIQPGDVVYFDVQDDVQGNFANAFSVAQMPDTTAIAWRYGVDRYDFKMFVNQVDFFKFLATDKPDMSSVHTFFYSKSGLVDTSNDFRMLTHGRNGISLNLNSKSSVFTSSETKDGTWVGKSEVELNNGISINSIVPLSLKVEIVAKPLNFESLKFPVHYGLDSVPAPSLNNKQFLNLALEYKRFKDEFKKTKVIVSTEWQDRVGRNLVDGYRNTIWQADRVMWAKNSQSIIFSVNKSEVYDRFVYVNSFSDNSPTKMDILASENGNDWINVGVYTNSKRLGNGEMAEVRFTPISTKFIKVDFVNSLNNDSPGVSEAWLVPARFSDLDIGQADLFLANMFGGIASLSDYNLLLRSLSNIGMVDVYWSNNSRFGWQKSNDSSIKVVFDGKRRIYDIPIAPGGTLIDKLKFVVTDLPGEITIDKIRVQY